MSDPFFLEVLQARLIGVVREMQNALFRTGYSTVIRESHDASCAILDREGQVVAQYTVLPLHLGAFPACAAGVLERYPAESLREGDAFLVNHPYLGGSPHASDMGVLTPAFHEGVWIGFCASMAHKTDIGGTVPGSGSGQAREIFHEGLQLPPVRFVDRGAESAELAAVIAANSRTPELVLGDIRGQIGACRLGERRLRALFDRYGREPVLTSYPELYARVEQRLRSAVSAWPDGRYEGESWLDDDGIDLERPVRLHVVLEIEGERIRFDFSGCAPQTRGPANIRPPLVRAVCYYALKCLVDPALPGNHGLARVVETAFRRGTVVDPVPPAPVNTYIPTAQALSEAVLRALGQVVPERQIAGSGGTGAVVIGGNVEGRSFLQYELMGAGLGARSGRDGVSGTTVHVGNSRVTPVEIVESEFPVQLSRFELLADSGGAGRYRGGLGFVREYRILAEGRLSTRGDRHTVAPFGLAGGKAGRPGATILNPGTPEERRLPARAGDVPLRPGDVLRIERAGGGGFGDPRERPRAAVERDMEEGYVTLEAARREYGWKRG